MSKPYTYQLRQAYGSDELLLEFFLNANDTEFGTDLLKTLNDINPVIESTEDLWMNDEVVLHINSDNGFFSLSKDVWGFAFIIAKNNQPCIKLIDEILNKSNLFKKEAADFEKYK